MEDEKPQRLALTKKAHKHVNDISASLGVRKRAVEKMLCAIVDRTIDPGHEFYEYCRWGTEAKIETPEEFYFRSVEYFREKAETNSPLTIAGLLLHLGIGRNTWNYLDERPGFGPVKERVLLFMEDYISSELLRREGQTKGLEFYLKNAFGSYYRDEVRTVSSDPQQSITSAQTLVVLPTSAATMEEWKSMWQDGQRKAIDVTPEEVSEES